ncbi:6-hydroxymethylpterin diphosphokinase MptE-like protein, partial [Priestia megaterium]
LLSYKNKHLGESCFVIGNGPSLNGKDLDLIKKHYSLASNSIYYLFDEVDWRPTYYFCQDQTVLEKSRNDISRHLRGEKFIRATGYDKHRIKGATYFKVDNTNYKKNKPPEFSFNVNEQIYEGYTVTYSMIQFAIFMGFKKIYLLGVDFDYQIKNGKIDGTSYPDKRMKDKIGGLPDIEYNYLAYSKALSTSENIGVEIINLTRGGKLNVFKRSNLEDIKIIKEKN